ncbi:hypothetical protein Syun_018791 [Stephania yunnanensis]|uniref:Secreted protein n=1 Tax=Stephania yunnanensis TaxID=152371 RepID=A0AAP0IT25_9MAGN
MLWFLSIIFSISLTHSASISIIISLFSSSLLCSPYDFSLGRVEAKLHYIGFLVLLNFFQKPMVSFVLVERFSDSMMDCVQCLRSEELCVYVF